MQLRTIRRIVTGTTQYDGAGVKLVRVVGHPDVEDFDPFLMMDAFDSTDPADYIKGFPWHPHRGIETVTYLIHGDIEHGDSLGNKGSILDGGCQWMTAGGGILHQEMPQAADRMLGVQLWLNLPKKDKMTDPAYHDIRADMVPEMEEDGCTIRVIAGQYKGRAGAAQGSHVDMTFLDVDMQGEASIKIETNRDSTLFVYIIEGEGWFSKTEDKLLYSRRAVLFNEGDALFARASGKGMRFLFFSGAPLKEPVAWGGPIVMNTREELMQAFREIDEGTFVKK
ncbi:MAG: pirin family protein [Eubacteriales bacterium]